jgi:DNA-binding IclR family transcriptional regulator
LNLWELAQPLIEELAAELEETCSATTLDLPRAHAISAAWTNAAQNRFLDASGPAPLRSLSERAFDHGTRGRLARAFHG